MTTSFLENTKYRQCTVMDTSRQDDFPLPKSIEKYHTLEEFKAHFEKCLHERLGLEVIL